jgi:hypothetical protein
MKAAQVSGKTLGDAKVKSLVLAGALAVAACRSGANLEGCRTSEEVLRATQSLARAEWNATTPDNAAEIWPFAFSFGSRNPAMSGPCSGSTELFEQNRVISGECVCCVLFLFGERAEGSTCGNQLEAFVVHQTFASSADAWRFVEALFATFSAGKAKAFNQKAPLPASASGAWNDTPSIGVDTMADMEVSKTDSGYHVRVYVSRTRRVA